MTNDVYKGLNALVQLLLVTLAATCVGHLYGAWYGWLAFSVLALFAPEPASKEE